MTPQDALNETLNMEVRYLILDQAPRALQLSQYISFVELVENRKLAEATELLTQIKADLTKNSDDRSLDQFNLLSAFLDKWLQFARSDGAEQVVANYSAERLKRYGG